MMRSTADASYSGRITSTDTHHGKKTRSSMKDANVSNEASSITRGMTCAHAQWLLLFPARSLTDGRLQVLLRSKSSRELRVGWWLCLRADRGVSCSQLRARSTGKCRGQQTAPDAHSDGGGHHDGGRCSSSRRRTQVAAVGSTALESRQGQRNNVRISKQQQRSRQGQSARSRPQSCSTPS
jgi:hypothetical protein